MHKLTEQELREPDVTLIIPLDKWKALPAEVRDTLAMYIDTGNYTTHRFTVPAYVVRQLERIAAGQ